MNESIIAEKPFIYTADDYFDFIKKYAHKKYSFVSYVLEKNTHPFISNIKTKAVVVTVQNDAWLVTVNNKEYDNAITCSPYTVYIGYPKEIAKKFSGFWMKGLIYVFPRLFSVVFKSLKINKVVQVNNNLISFSNYSPFFCNNFESLLNVLVNSYQRHAILFPHVNEVIDHKLTESLRKFGFILIQNRATHLYDPASKYMNRTDVKKDLDLLKKSKYTVIRHEELTTADLDRIFELYQQLFIKKHTYYNPNFTKEYFYYSHKYRWNEYIALRNTEGIIDAYTAWCVQNNVMMATGCGYDLDQPRELGLYRMANVLGLQHADENNYLYNLGGGSDQFKLNRGSKKVTEYLAVYCDHLPFFRRIPWNVLAWCGEKILPSLYRVNML